MSPSPTIMTSPQNYSRGCAMVLFSGLVFSTGGLIVRHVTAWDWQIVFYRSIGVLFGLAVLLLLRDKGAVFHTIRRTGLAGSVAGFFMALAMIGFVLAVNATSVANALFLMAAAPFLAALLGWLLLSERVAGVTWAAMATALVGVTIMVWHGLTAGSLFGTAMGLMMALGVAGFSVALRSGRRGDMMPAVCVGGGISAIAAACVSIFSGAGLAIPAGEIVLCAGYGVLTAVGLVVFTVGSRHVPAAVLTLLALTEVLLGPFWVWIFLGEVPHEITIVGGSVLMLAITGQAIAGMIGRRGRSAEQQV